MFCIKHDGTQYVEASCETPDALLVITRIELQQMSPFYLDIESAVQISGALLMAMGVAFLIRMARKLLEQSSTSESE